MENIERARLQSSSKDSMQAPKGAQQASLRCLAAVLMPGQVGSAQGENELLAAVQQTVSDKHLRAFESKLISGSGIMDLRLSLYLPPVVSEWTAQPQKLSILCHVLCRFKMTVDKLRLTSEGNQDLG